MQAIIGDSQATMSDTIKTDSILFYSTTWCGDCRRSRKVFDALGVSYIDIDIEEHPEAAEIVRRLNRGAQSVPTILFPDGSMLVEPSNATLEVKLNALTGARSA
jgi:mycoredoxin